MTTRPPNTATLNLKVADSAAQKSTNKPIDLIVRWLLAKQGVRVVTICAALVALLATIIAYKHGTILAYNDATAHLNTGRRITDSLTPGIVQVGSVWLPLLHLLLVPFVSIDWLWQTGLAGSIVSGISFVVLNVFTYKLLLRVSKGKRLIGAIGIAIILTSPNLLYLQATAMFETLLLAMTTIAVYFLVKWSETKALHDLILAAAFTMLATLTRYDGWAFFVVASVMLIAQGILLRDRIHRSMSWIFIVLGGFGIFLWLLYNGMIFHDPLYFQRGPYSASAQQAILASQHHLPSQHNLGLSAELYGTAIVYNIGLLLPVAAIAGAIWYLKDSWRKPKQWFPWLFAIPLPFNIVSLYSGQSVIWFPSLPPYFDSFFNARYGILLLPAVVFFCAYLAKKRRWLTAAVAAVVVLQVVSFVLFYPHLHGQPRGLVTLHDSQSAVNQQVLDTTSYLHDHYQGGLIMASSASMDSLIFHADLHLRNFITEGNGYYWNTSLKYPEKYATWAVTFVDHTDAVGKVFNGSGPKSQFKVVYQNQTFQVWHKN